MLEKYNGKEIKFKNVDGQQWVCLTDMAKATGKKVNDWSRLESTKKLINALESVASYKIIQTLRGGNDVKNQGTFAILPIALDFARWCSQDFYIQLLLSFSQDPSNFNFTKKEYDTSGYVYLISNSIHYKIGCSKNPEERLQDLSIGSSLELSLIDKVYCEDMKKLENKLHQYFKNKEIKPEWFDLDEKDVNNFLLTVNKLSK